jgi:hypothetical protein
LLTLLAHTACEIVEQRLVGANTLDVDLVATAVVGDTGLRTLGKAGNGGEDGTCEQGDGGGECGTHGEDVRC